MPAPSSHLAQEEVPRIWSRRPTPQYDGKYESIHVWRPDLKRIRQLEYDWRRSRVQVIHALINLADHSTGMKPIQSTVETWERLDDLAHSLSLHPDDLVARVLDLVSHCTSEQLLQLLPTTETKEG